MVIKEYVKWIIAAVLLVALIGGATVLYNKLGGEKGSNVQILDESTDTQEQSTESTEISSDTTAELNSETVPEQIEQVENKMDPAYDFTFTDMDGKPIMLSDLIGKPIVLNFWATWCIYCRNEMPDFEEIYKQYGDEINFVMMNVTSGSETVEVAKSFIENAGYSFPVYFDTQRAGAAKYNTARGIPMTYFFDKNGVFKARTSGAIDAATLENVINMIK